MKGNNKFIKCPKCNEYKSFHISNGKTSGIKKIKVSCKFSKNISQIITTYKCFSCDYTFNDSIVTQNA